MLQAISEKVGEQRELQKQGQDIQLELKEMEHKVSKFQRDSKEAATKVSFPSVFFRKFLAGPAYKPVVKGMKSLNEVLETREKQY